MCCGLQVIITDDVNLRSIATGEGIMAVAKPGYLPKKRKDFLPKMFTSLPEDSAVSCPAHNFSVPDIFHVFSLHSPFQLSLLQRCTCDACSAPRATPEYLMLGQLLC